MDLKNQLKCILLGHRYGRTLTTENTDYADMGHPSITLHYRECERCGIQEYDKAEYDLIDELEKKRKQMAKGKGK